MEYKNRIFRPGTSTNIQRYHTFWNRFVVICILGNRFYEQILVFLPSVFFINENMASSCEEFSEFRGQSEFKLEPMGGGGGGGGGGAERKFFRT